ncbi:alpha/beta fold hydrolase [Tardiphaga sp. 215_C5_N2_1]|uniref:alpha/beta fold hydrolase n=1 Tax=Tardiphaga sp. 215_C5_N2_1 TaxID=3240774 RepID=UPI003F8A0A76
MDQVRMDVMDERICRRREIEIDDCSGGRIAAIEFGSTDRPIEVVFAHANGLNALAYRRILDPLAHQTRVLAYDHRGHGRSTLPPLQIDRRDWSDITADLVALLDRVAEEPVLLVGHSMGGAAAFLASLQRPALVCGVLMLDPVLHPSLPSPPEATGMAAAASQRRSTFPSRQDAIEAYRGRGAFKTWPPSCLEDYVTDGFRDRPLGDVELSCPPRWEASSFMATGHDDWEALAKASLPTRILRAENGSFAYLPPRIGPSIDVITVPGTTHFLPFERPDVVRNHVIAALEQRVRAVR